MADQQGVTRKLAAILYADVAGYSKLTGSDEEGTHRTVADYLDAMSGLVGGHGGRVVHYAGDAVLADFASVVAAVKCAIEFQKELGARNADVPDDRKVQFRIGVNLGDVIVDRDDIYGNGVNVAARLESLADAGGICISQKVLEEVEGKVDVNFEDMGPKEVKNIAKPVQAYRVILDKPAPTISTAPSATIPSIAVLPFGIIGSDPRTSDLADALTEDLITALAKVRELLVIDRHSTDIYKGRSTDIQEVAKALGVRYVLEGSIRTAGDRMRCSVQLVDTALRQHVWAERYDRSIDDVFALLDEIVWHILLELQVRLTEGDGARIASRGTRNLDAWLLRVQGAHELGRITREGSIRARGLFEAAHKADPNWARPLAGIAATHYYDARYGWSRSREKSIAAGLEYAERAVVKDPEEAFGYVVLRCVHVLRGDHDNALKFIERAATLAPNDQLVVGNLASQLMHMDKIDEAVQVFGRMVRLGPNPHIALQRGRGLALMLAGRADQAVDVFENLVRREPTWRDGLVHLAMAYANAGRPDQARKITKQVLEQAPALRVSDQISNHYFRNSERTEWLRRLLIEAGLPE